MSQVSSTESRERGRGEREESGEISEGSEAGDQVVIELEREDSDIQGDKPVEVNIKIIVVNIRLLVLALGRSNHREGYHCCCEECSTHGCSSGT